MIKSKEGKFYNIQIELENKYMELSENTFSLSELLQYILIPPNQIETKEID